MNCWRKATTIALLAVGIAGSQAFAQIQGVFDLGQLGNTLTQSATMYAHSERSARRMGKGRSSKRSGTRSSKARTSATVSQTLGTFKQSAAARKRNIAKFIAETRSSNPQGAASLEKVFATQDVFGMIGKKLAPYGLKTNNVADPMAIYLVMSWQGARGRNNNPVRSQLLGVRAQLARAVTTTPDVRRMSDSQKQEVADSMLLHAMLVDSLVDAAKKQPAQMPLVKRAIASGVRNTFGFNINAMKLTNRGLEL